MPNSNTKILEETGLQLNDTYGKRVELDRKFSNSLLLQRKIKARLDAVITIENEGVASERPYFLTARDPHDPDSLTAVYQGTLTRELIGMIVKDVMERRGLSLRGAADETGFHANQIGRIRAGRATIDKSLDFLRALGCDLEASARVSNITEKTPSVE